MTMLLLEGAGGGDSGAEDPRDHRIAELRRVVERLRAQIAERQQQQRQAVLELNELLEEQRHLAQRARQQRASRLGRDAERGVESPDDQPEEREAP